MASSASGDRFQLPPTAAQQTAIKARLVAASRGHALLKKKADALTIRLRELVAAVSDD